MCLFLLHLLPGGGFRQILFSGRASKTVHLTSKKRLLFPVCRLIVFCKSEFKQVLVTQKGILFALKYTSHRCILNCIYPVYHPSLIFQSFSTTHLLSPLGSPQWSVLVNVIRELAAEQWNPLVAIWLYVIMRYAFTSLSDHLSACMSELALEVVKHPSWTDTGRLVGLAWW